MILRIVQWTIPNLLHQFRRKNSLVHKGSYLLLFQLQCLELPEYDEISSVQVSKNVHLRNEFIFWNVHGIMNTSGLFTLSLKETRSIHDSMNRPKIEFVTYIYILYYQSSINFQVSLNLAGFPVILN